MAGLQEFPRSPDSAEKKRKLAQTFLKSLIWRVKKGGGTRKEESCLGQNRRSSGQLRVLSRFKAVSLLCEHGVAGLQLRNQVEKSLHAMPGLQNGIDLGMTSAIGV